LKRALIVPYPFPDGRQNSFFYYLDALAYPQDVLYSFYQYSSEDLIVLYTQHDDFKSKLHDGIVYVRFNDE